MKTIAVLGRQPPLTQNKTPAEIRGRSVFGNDEMRQALATPAIA